MLEEAVHKYEGITTQIKRISTEELSHENRQINVYISTDELRYECRGINTQMQRN